MCVCLSECIPLNSALFDSYFNQLFSIKVKLTVACIRLLTVSDRCIVEMKNSHIGIVSFAQYAVISSTQCGATDIYIFYICVLICIYE